MLALRILRMIIGAPLLWIGTGFAMAGIWILGDDYDCFDDPFNDPGYHR